MYIRRVMLAALHLVVLAGGGDAADNHHSHLVHVRGVVQVALEAGVPEERITVFWADGEDPGPDRSVVRTSDVDGVWMLEETPIERNTRPELELVDTRFPYAVLPATRESLSGWLERNGPQMRDGDTLLFAVTDHGKPGEDDRPNNTSVTLWGESWTVDQLGEDLVPVPEPVRVVLWMSQCFSGGFARLASERPNTCGAFSANWDRVAYGCFSELAGRPDLGHFSNLLTSLARSGVLSVASDEVLLSDDAPDTPHLSSDDVLLAELEKGGDDFDQRVGTALDKASGTAPGRRLAAQIAGRYGLGAMRTLRDVEAVIEELHFADFTGRAWADARRAALWTLLGRLAKKPARTIGEPRGRRARRRGRQRGVNMIRRIATSRRGLKSRLNHMHREDVAASEIFERVEMQLAAAERVRRLYFRVGGAALLAGEAKQRYERVRACESTPLWTPPPAPNPRDFVGPPHERRPMVPVSQLLSEIEALRPAYLGIGYRSGKGGVEIEKVVPGGPAAAAGLQRFDIITSVDGWKLVRDQDIAIVAVTSTPGATLRLKVKRKGRGRPQDVALVLAPMPLPEPLVESTRDAP